MADGGSGPADTSGSSQELASLVGPITPAKATNAVNVDVSFGSRSAVVVGAPQLQLTYRGTSPPGARPTRVFAQLVDESTGLVLGNQITPIDVTLDGRTHTTSVPLEMVAFTGKPNDHIELQLVATTVAYAHPALGRERGVHPHPHRPAGGVGHPLQVDRRAVTGAAGRSTGPRSLAVALDGPLGPDRRLLGTAAGVTEGPTLAEQVPELVEGDLDGPQPCFLLGRRCPRRRAAPRGASPRRPGCRSG